jgi:hypothetical protein
VIFSNLSYGVANALQWQLGDGTVSSVRHPTHMYNTAGMYDVTLVISNYTFANGWSRDVLVRTNYLHVIPERACCQSCWRHGGLAHTACGGMRNVVRRYGMLAAGPLVALILSVWPHSDDAQRSICAFRRYTGLPCATCGMTRALSALTHGDGRRAYQYHPLSAAVAVLLVAAWAVTSWCWFHGRPVPRPLRRAWFAACFATGAACFILWCASVVFPAAAHIWYNWHL